MGYDPMTTNDSSHHNDMVFINIHEKLSRQFVPSLLLEMDIGIVCSTLSSRLYSLPGRFTNNHQMSDVISVVFMYECIYAHVFAKIYIYTCVYIYIYI